MQKIYPDISDLLAAKARRRHELAALPWEEKVRIIEQMQMLLSKGSWQTAHTQKATWQLQSNPKVAADAPGGAASSHSD